MNAAPEREPEPGVPVPIRDKPSVAIAISLPKAMQPYARSPMRWRIGCIVDVLRDGDETYPAMLAAIAGAKRAIHLETYILAADRTGQRFKDALVERARAGVAVRIIYDAIGSFGLSGAFVGDLRAAGATVIDYNPIAPWRRRFNLSHRDHRKILVIDDEVAFTGGLNIANDYASVDDGGVGWHDTHCRVRGPIVLDLARMFRRTWLRAGGDTYAPPPSASTAPGAGGASFVRLLDNTKRRSRATIRRAYVHAIRAARQSIAIQNAYFLPDRGIRRALRRAVRRGVDVRVLVPLHSDVKLLGWAGLYVYRRLAKAGVKVLRWRGAMMHAKTAVVDAIWSTIGSYNFDAMSRFNNLEVTVEILDSNIGGELVRQFDGDAAGCDPFDEAAWLRLSWWRKALAWLSFRLRRLL
jgi:cardiolipin synthase A/B